ncbi:hypothetical protein PMAYCL1PPCAC_12996, partial [Pristionchus mayeri]
LVPLLFFLPLFTAIPFNISSHLLTDSTDLTFFKVINGVNRTCQWVGTAPFCNGECASDYDEIERRQTLYTPPDCVQNLFHFCTIDPYFGERCTFPFNSKAICCKKVKQ